MDKRIIIENLWPSDTVFESHWWRDDRNDMLIYFKKEVLKKWYTVTTKNNWNQNNIYIYRNYTKKIKTNPKNSYIIIREPDCVIPNNKYAYWLNMRKIFTWNDNLVDHNKIFKLNFCQKKINNVNRNTWEKFCCLISSNKFSFHKNELYSERRKAIKFFEKNYKEEFDLYWTRWNKLFIPFKTNLKHIFKKDFSILKIFQYVYIILFENNFKSYKWTVDSKYKTLQKYKFAICYENQLGYNWYITEKIWDCFFSWCIPIYLWAKNIEKYIPKNCFIDKRDFKSYTELYNHLKQLNNKDISNIKENIKKYINSDNAKKHYSEEWCNTLINNIL